MYTQYINLDVIPEGVRPVIYVSQYDNQVTALNFTLFKQNTLFNIPSGAGVIINGYKPDNTAFSYAATAIDTNTVTFSVTQQMTAVAGDVLCELRVRTSSEIIGTLNFVLRVEPAPLHDDSVLSDTEIPLIEQAIDIAANLAQYIQQTMEARDEAVTASSAAQTASSAAVTAASEAAVDAANIYAMYDSIETAKSSANNAAQAAQSAASAIANISAVATTLAAGSSATATYNTATHVLTLGIPTGATGQSGIQTQISGMFTLSVDSDGNLWAHYNDDELTAANFRYDSDTGNLYYVITEGE